MNLKKRSLFLAFRVSVFIVQCTKDLLLFNEYDNLEIENLLKEDPLKAVYHSTIEDLRNRMTTIIGLIVR